MRHTSIITRHTSQVAVDYIIATSALAQRLSSSCPFCNNVPVQQVMYPRTHVSHVTRLCHMSHARLTCAAGHGPIRFSLQSFWLQVCIIIIININIIIIIIITLLQHRGPR